MDVLEKALKYNQWIHNYRNHHYYAKFGRVNNKLLLSNDIIKIKFVRNPYSRAVSSFLHVMKTNKIKKLFNNEDMSFYEFLLNIKKNIYPNNIHYNLQMINSEKKNTFNHIIKIENLEKEIKNLNKRFNLNLNYDFTSSHHIIKKRINTNVSDVKFSKILEIPNYSSFYDKKTKDLVDEIYNLDIIEYNYTFEEFLKYDM
jgi:hypothetical protein